MKKHQLASPLNKKWESIAGKLRLLSNLCSSQSSGSWVLQIDELRIATIFMLAIMSYCQLSQWWGSYVIPTSSATCTLWRGFRGKIISWFQQFFESERMTPHVMPVNRKWLLEPLIMSLVCFYKFVSVSSSSFISYSSLTLYLIYSCCIKGAGMIIKLRDFFSVMYLKCQK